LKSHLQKRLRKSSVRDLPTAPSPSSLFARCGNLARRPPPYSNLLFFSSLLFLTQSTQNSIQHINSTMSDAAQQKDGQFSHDNTTAPVTDRVMPLFSLKGKTAIVSGAGAGSLVAFPFIAGLLIFQVLACKSHMLLPKLERMLLSGTMATRRPLSVPQRLRRLMASSVCCQCLLLSLTIG